jgi:VanZ family protein
MGAIFVVSAQSTVPSAPGRWDLLLKKGMHVLAYGILTWLYLRAMRGHRLGDGWVRVVSAALALAYALSDEYHQSFVPGRNGNLIDVMVDGIGIGGVILFDWWCQAGRRGRSDQASG